jgi:uncharacterized damage-inducible protein DinB
MRSNEVLIDGFGRVHDIVHGVLDGLTREQLTHRIDPQANTIAWLVWHLTRVQDDHVADVAGTEQVWTSQGWVERFALPFEPMAHGYGQSAEQVGQVQADADLLRDYFDAVHQASVDYLKNVADDDLDRVVDTRWDPPVTLGVRLVSVITDDLQHAGQAAYARGVIERTT